jgi:HK97 family phage prohead protease
MPYFISDKQGDCSGWAAVKQETDGSYTTIGCHQNKQDAIDQMVAVSISEDMEPGGEINKRQVDLTVPTYVRQNAQRGLEWLRQGFGGDGLTEKTKREAREMADGSVSESKARRMAAWFARHMVDLDSPEVGDESKPTAGMVAHALWGGYPKSESDRAMKWAQRKVAELDAEADNSRSKQVAKKIERRTFAVQKIEARAAEDGTMRLSGYAAVFDNPSVPLPFVERIAPGAFRKTLSEMPDVRLLINHEGLPLARTKNGTLTLSEDEVGLRFDALIADTTEGRDLYALVERGDLDQMSFAFRVIRQAWNSDRSERTLKEVSLADGDVSVVTYPAYPTTSVEAREKLASAIRAIKEGREVTGESLMVLQAIFDDLSEGHDYVMKAVESMSMLMGNGEMEEEAREEVGDFVSWDSSGGTARGKIEEIKREGVLQIPDSDFSITAEEDDPAVLIRVYEEFRDGWRATETLVGHKMSELRYIDPLPEATEEQSRKISLRYAKALRNVVK